MGYTDIIRDLLENQYPQPEKTTDLVISNIVLRILPLPARPYFLRYEFLQTLVISKCDLRNLENFPKLLSLKQLDISENSLQGTLNYLMPLRNLNYLNIANNIIHDYRKFQPLQVIQGLEIYLVGNPFIDGESWKSKLKGYGLKVVKQARVLELTTKKCKQQEKKIEINLQKQQIQRQQKLRKQRQQNEQKQKKIKKQEEKILEERNNKRETFYRNYYQLELDAPERRPARRHIEHQGRIQADMFRAESESLSMFGVLEEHEMHHLFQNDDEESEQLNAFNNIESENDPKDEEDNDEDEPEVQLQNSQLPLLGAYDDDEDLDRDEDQLEESSSD